MYHDFADSDLVQRDDVIRITDETGSLETQQRVRELPARTVKHQVSRTNH